MITRTLALLLLLCSAHAFADEEAATKAAEETLDRYISNFNDKDPKAWASVLHIPYVSFADGQVVIYPTREAAIDAVDFETFAETTGWRRSAVLSRRVVQASEDKVHLATRMARYNEAGEAYMQFDGLFIIEKAEGRWGVRAYSRLAMDR